MDDPPFLPVVLPLQLSPATVVHGSGVAARWDAWSAVVRGEGGVRPLA